jgi:hypothetical protein
MVYLLLQLPGEQPSSSLSFSTWEAARGVGVASYIAGMAKSSAVSFIIHVMAMCRLVGYDIEIRRLQVPNIRKNVSPAPRV